MPLLVVEWVDSPAHRAGMNALLTAGQRQLSLVDCVSFDVIRRFGWTHVFAFDRCFEEQGFLVVG